VDFEHVGEEARVLRFYVFRELKAGRLYLKLG